MDYSVVITTHNRQELVVRAIRSVYAQTCPPSDVIVIDDASDPALVLPSDLCTEPTRLLRHEQYLGGTASREIGMREALTRIVMYLDDSHEWPRPE